MSLKNRNGMTLFAQSVIINEHGLGSRHEIAKPSVNIVQILVALVLGTCQKAGCLRYGWSNGSRDKFTAAICCFDMQVHGLMCDVTMSQVETILSQISTAT